MEATTDGKDSCNSHLVLFWLNNTKDIRVALIQWTNNK